MPSRDRQRSAVARVDVLLSDWARSVGLPVSPGRVRAWRRAGLLPDPSEPMARPPEAPAGRAADGYSETTLEVAHQVVTFLAAHARRGRPSSDLALLLFAAGLPVRHELVIDGLRAWAVKVRRELGWMLRNAATYSITIDPSMQLSDAYERAEELARMAMETRCDLARDVRAQLRSAGQPAGTSDLFTVLIALFRTVLGEPPPSDDPEVLGQMLHAFGAHGLVEPVAPDVAPVLDEGPSELANALEVNNRAGLLDIPEDIAPSELASALRFARELGEALAAIPAPLTHHLGGDAVTGFWQPNDPFKVAQILTWTIKVRRSQPLDPTPIVEAVRDQGWLAEASVPGPRPFSR